MLSGMLKLVLIFAVIGVISYNFEHRAVAYAEMNVRQNSFSIYDKNTDGIKSEKTQQTVLRLFDMRHRFNEGDPIPFVGKLTDKSGTPIPDAKITVLHDGACKNKIVGEGVTDKRGRFLVITDAKIWDEKDNLVKVHAEFLGQGKFLSSTSESNVVVVLPLQHKNCLL